MTDFGPWLVGIGVVVIAAVVLYIKVVRPRLEKPPSVLVPTVQTPTAPVVPAVPIVQTGWQSAPPVATPAPAVTGFGGFPLPLSGEGMQEYMQRAGISVGTYQWQMQAEAAQHPGHGWDEIADRVMHPEHFYTQADLDTIAAAQRTNVDTVYPQVDGVTVPASSFTTDDDLKAIYQLSAKWGGNWPFRHVSGTQSQINRLLAKYANEPASANLDLSTYTGALAPVMNLP
jgi:hypothetical protein